MRLLLLEESPAEVEKLSRRLERKVFSELSFTFDISATIPGRLELSVQDCDVLIIGPKLAEAAPELAHRAKLYAINLQTIALLRKNTSAGNTKTSSCRDIRRFIEESAPENPVQKELMLIYAELTSQFQSFSSGKLINGCYEVIKVLGTGRMGFVYLCKHRELAGQLVAMKVLFPEVSRDAQASSHFRNEIVASYGVAHPNVVRAYEYFNDGEVTAYTMEYVSGGDLAHLMSGEKPVSIAEGVRMLRQIASGLHAIHSAGIVHRDLKPENILLTEQGNVKITDFGIARAFGECNLTDYEGVVGTIDYVSPEYLESGALDTRSDIYALGVIAFELLTNNVPFTGKSVVEQMTLRLRQDPPSLGSYRKDCPAELDQIVRRAMSRDPALRYQTASQLAEALQALVF